MRRRRSSSSSSSSSSLDEEIKISAYSEKYPISRSSILAQELFKQRVNLESELKSLTVEKNNLNNEINRIEMQIFAIKNKTNKRKTVSNSTESLETDLIEENKKIKKESEDSSDVKNRVQLSTTTLKQPLFQKLLLGTLIKSQNEVEKSKTDKNVSKAFRFFFKS